MCLLMRKRGIAIGIVETKPELAKSLLLIVVSFSIVCRWPNDGHTLRFAMHDSVEQIEKLKQKLIWFVHWKNSDLCFFYMTHFENTVKFQVSVVYGETCRNR